MIRPNLESISSMLVTSLPLRVALPIGSHPDTTPARTHHAPLPYTPAATAPGTQPDGKFSSLIGVYLLSTAILSLQSLFVKKNSVKRKEPLFQGSVLLNHNLLR